MKEWITKLVLDFRKGYKKLSGAEKSKVTNLDKLTPPLQIEVISVKNEKLYITHQLFIFTHFQDIKDLTINIHEIDSCNAIEKLQEIVKDRKWQRKLPKDERYFIKDESKKKFATIIEGFFIDLLHGYKRRVLNSIFSQPKEIKTEISRKTYLTKDSFIWETFGDARKIETKKVVNKIIEETKKRAKTQPQSSSPQPARPKMSGFGTYFYPPIWIGKISKPSFSEQIFETNIPLLPKKAFDAEYKGNKVVVNENGFIAIGIKDKNLALKRLNEIMATALLLDIPFLAIRQLDLHEAEMDPEKLTICSHGISTASPRAILFEEEWTPKQKYNDVFRKKREVSKQDLIKIIKRAEALSKKKMSGELLIYFLESFTHIEESEYNQSFVMSWLIIEKYLSSRWKDFIKEKAIGGNRKDKLEDWTIGQFLEVLHLSKKITKKQYKLFMEMKKKRDKFVHEGKQISKENAQKSFKTCVSIIELFRDKNFT